VLQEHLFAISLLTHARVRKGVLCVTSNQHVLRREQIPHCSRFGSTEISRARVVRALKVHRNIPTRKTTTRQARTASAVPCRFPPSSCSPLAFPGARSTRARRHSRGLRRAGTRR
ncbi:unnamed protein product, partial [Ectocarpus sp. 8 AP-2014]